MLNLHLTAAITAAHVSLANVPSEAADDVMNHATQAVAVAVDRVCRIPAFTVADVETKLVLSAGLEEWDNLSSRLAGKALCELKTIIFNERKKVEHIVPLYQKQGGGNVRHSCAADSRRIPGNNGKPQ